MDKTQQIILTKLDHNKLGHFYQINPSEVCPSEELLSWCQEIVVEYAKKNFGILTKTNNLVDLLIINSDEKKYEQQAFSSFFHFMNYAPMQMDRRFTIINNAHLISDAIYNKLLKSFEEPPQNHHVFLLNPKKIKLLATIEGRAQKLLYLKKNKSLLNDYRQSKIFKLFKELEGPMEISDKIKSSLDLESQLVEFALIWGQEKANLSCCNELLEIIKNYKTSQTFHNYSLGRIFTLVNFLYPHIKC